MIRNSEPEGIQYDRLDSIERSILREQLPGTDLREFWNRLSPEQQIRWSERLRRYADSCPCGCDGDEEEHRA